MPADITLNPDVVSSTLEGGGVLLDLTTKQYFALNESGLAIWQHLEDGGRLDAVYGAADAGRAGVIDTFVSALLEHRLASPAAAAPGASADAPAFAPPQAWDAPTLVPHGRPLSQVILSPFDPTIPIPE